MRSAATRSASRSSSAAIRAVARCATRGCRAIPDTRSPRGRWTTSARSSPSTSRGGTGGRQPLCRGARVVLDRRQPRLDRVAGACRRRCCSRAASRPSSGAWSDIGPGTVRLSIGIEDADDLIEDLRQALAVGRSHAGRSPAPHRRTLCYPRFGTVRGRRVMDSRRPAGWFSPRGLARRAAAVADRRAGRAHRAGGTAGSICCSASPSTTARSSIAGSCASAPGPARSRADARLAARPSPTLQATLGDAPAHPMHHRARRATKATR